MRRPFTTYDIIQLVNALADTMTTITAADINIASVSKARSGCPCALQPCTTRTPERPPASERPRMRAAQLAWHRWQVQD
jgi:hypothetical protein